MLDHIELPDKLCCKEITAVLRYGRGVLDCFSMIGSRSNRAVDDL